MQTFETQVAGLTLRRPVMNAAGTCKLLPDVQTFAGSDCAAIVVGSITVLERPGNVGRTIWIIRSNSLNSIGLQNPGRDYYQKNLPAMVKIAHDAGKPLIVSVAGFSPRDYADLAGLAFSCGADAVELNLGCTNTRDRGSDHPIVSFYPQQIDVVLGRVKDEVGAAARVGVKLSPYSDPMGLKAAGRSVVESGLVKFVTTSNTFPNAFDYGNLNDSEPAITVGEGLAGLAGPAMRTIGLGQVRQWRKILPDEIAVIGVGGVDEGRHVRQYLQCGASVVAVATAILEKGVSVVGVICDDYWRITFEAAQTKLRPATTPVPALSAAVP